MSNFQQKPGFGSLFRNKKESDKQPDYRGDACTPKGEQIRIAGWLKKDKNDKTYLSLKVEEPREQQSEAPANKPAGRPARAADFDDEVPF
jgi:uncharacterized protein (DUF736 family)